MSMPNIPFVPSNININKEDALNVVLASIGFEELSLAHLINAEAEKVQFALGTLETATEAQSFEDILIANESASSVLKNAIKMEMLLSMKLEDAISAYATITPVDTDTNDDCEEDDDDKDEDKDKDKEEKADDNEPTITTEPTDTPDVTAV